jgi:hypothetical protein
MRLSLASYLRGSVTSHPSWYFKAKQPDDTIREPIQGEFFATEAIADSAEALVREAIQNSLDARLPNESVRVRFYVSGPDAAVAPKSLEPFTKDLIPHLKAEGNGLQSSPSENEKCRFLVVEDFGTSGLRGDVSTWRHAVGVQNDFYSFFRAEGQSDKGETARGRWGIGKFVFPRVSRASCFFGLTVRENPPERVLMGRAILRSHDIQNTTYVPDGYYGVKPLDLVLPVDSAATIQSFTSLFRLSRTNDAGLSVVVPWCDDSVTVDSILAAVLRAYYYAIMSGQLDVVVEDATNAHLINASSIDAVVDERAQELGLEMRPFLALAKWALATEETDLVRLEASRNQYGPTWDQSMIPAAVAKQLSSSLNRGERIAVRVPLSVKAKGMRPQHSYFDVFLVRSGEETAGRVTFIREGIIVSAAGGKRPAGINAIVVINQGPLANLLGDSENPAHTEWRRDTRGLQEKYSYASSYLTFVKQSVATIARYLSEGDIEPDNDLLRDLFSLATDDASLSAVPRPVSKSTTGTEKDPPPIPDIPRRPSRFQVSKNASGFMVTQGSAAAVLPFSLQIAVAYDIRSGNPLKHYDDADFDMGRKPIVVLAEEGAEITTIGGNSFGATISSLPFKISVEGFDPHRDLMVKVVSEDVIDGD